MFFATAAAGLTALGLGVLRTQIAKPFQTSPHAGGVSLPPNAGSLRDAVILAAIEQGDIKPRWTRIRSEVRGHVGEFDVLADALTLGGIRLSTSAKTMQTIADKFASLLMTPKLLDLAFVQAPRKIAPETLSPNDSTWAMVTESKAIDTALTNLAQRGGPESGAVAPFGKHWVICKALEKIKVVTGKPVYAALYGWPVAPEYQQSFLKLHPGVSLHKGVVPGVLVIQPIATPHDFSYEDYAMTTHMVRRACKVDGKARDLVDVLRDPELAWLASHEGPLSVVRQPGVPSVPSMAVSGALERPEDAVKNHGVEVALHFLSLPLSGIVGHQIGKRLGTRLP
jgi:hypothetical protein